PVHHLDGRSVAVGRMDTATGRHCAACDRTQCAPRHRSRAVDLLRLLPAPELFDRIIAETSQPDTPPRTSIPPPTRTGSGRLEIRGFMEAALATFDGLDGGDVPLVAVVFGSAGQRSGRDRRRIPRRDALSRRAARSALRPDDRSSERPPPAPGAA